VPHNGGNPMEKTVKGVRRFDYGEIGEIKRTPQGFLLVPGFATRTGVFPYIDAQGKVRRELRHPDDVFAPESLATLKYAPITIEHPPEMITPENVAKYRKGHTTERVEVNRDLVETDLIIEDADAIQKVENEGLRELSSGYVADVVEEEGNFNGTPYDYRQKNIFYNHLAMVKRGRAGPEVRIRMDSDDAVMESNEISEPNRSEYGTQTSVMNADAEVPQQTKKVVISGQEVELPAGVADVVQALLDRYDEMKAQTMKLEESMDPKEKKDVEINQAGVSPQVKVEQGPADGRSAPGKIGAADRGGAARAKGDDESQRGVVGGPTPVGKADDDAAAVEAGKKDFEGSPQGGSAMSPIDLMKHELAELRGKNDAMQAKLDEMASATLATPEKKPDAMEPARMDSVRARVKLERKCEKLVGREVAEKFDSMSDDEIRCAVISHRHPKAELVGKSSIYIQTRFDSIVESEEENAGKEIRTNMGRELMGTRMDSKDRGNVDPNQARLNSINASRDLWKQPLTASKK